MKTILCILLFSISINSFAAWKYDKEATPYYDITAYFAYLAPTEKDKPTVEIKAISYHNDNLMGLQLVIADGEFGCNIGNACYGSVQYDNGEKKELSFDVLNEDGKYIGDIYNDRHFVKKFFEAKKITLLIPIQGKGIVEYNYISEEIKWGRKLFDL